MTVGLNAGGSTVFNQFATSINRDDYDDLSDFRNIVLAAQDGLVGAFYDINENGIIDIGYLDTINTSLGYTYVNHVGGECVGLQAITEGFFGLALWGDDTSTPEKDGLGSGDIPQFAILHDGNVLLFEELPTFPGYVTNGIVNFNDAHISMFLKCTDNQACNFIEYDYTNVEYIDTGECSYDDIDEDGICDEDEVVGCVDSNACNFSDAATDEGFCIYPPFGNSCDNVVYKS